MCGFRLSCSALAGMPTAQQYQTAIATAGITGYSQTNCEPCALHCYRQHMDLRCSGHKSVSYQQGVGAQLRDVDDQGSCLMLLMLLHCVCQGVQEAGQLQNGCKSALAGQ